MDEIILNDKEKFYKDEKGILWYEKRYEEKGRIVTKSKSYFNHDEIHLLFQECLKVKDIHI